MDNSAVKTFPAWHQTPHMTCSAHTSAKVLFCHFVIRDLLGWPLDLKPWASGKHSRNKFCDYPFTSVSASANMTRGMSFARVNQSINHRLLHQVKAYKITNKWNIRCKWSNKPKANSLYKGLPHCRVCIIHHDILTQHQKLTWSHARKQQCLNFTLILPKTRLQSQI